MPGANVTMGLEGLDKLVDKLAKIGRRISGSMVKKALEAGASPIVSAMERSAPVASPEDTTRGIPIGPGAGLLSRSIGVKSKAKGSNAYVLIGPQRKIFKTLIGTKADGTAVYMNPTNYAHLVEAGHDIKLGGRTVYHFGGSHFAKQAFDSALPAAQAAIEQVFRDELNA